MDENFVELREGKSCHERYVCHCSYCEEHGPAFAEDRYSMGVYAGRFCDEGWKLSGYRDVGPEEFDPAYAGERMENDY
jgi:hypothetical protein